MASDIAPKLSKRPMWVGVWLGAFFGVLGAMNDIATDPNRGSALLSLNPDIIAYELGTISGGVFFGWLIGFVWYVVIYVINERKARHRARGTAPSQQP
jgi:hypothetical protein